MFPKIGITTDRIYDYKKNFEGYAYTNVSNCYITAVSQSGAVPCTIPIYDASEEQLQEQVLMLDGIIFSGGEDIDPKLWGAEPIKELGQLCKARDAFEIRLLQCALRNKLPILCICRGAQLVSTFLGGTLYQDIFTEAKATLAHRQQTHYDETIHNVSVSKNSQVYHIFGDTISVNSFHHMAVKKLGSGLVCTGKSSDGIIEMYESKSPEQFILGTQWHPEMLFQTDNKMREFFSFFISRCKTK